MLTRALGIGLALILSAGIAGASSTGFAGGGATVELSAQGGAKGKAKAAPKAKAAAPKAKAAPKAAAAPKAKAVNKNVNVKKNVNVNKNVNVKKNVTVNRNVNVTYNRGYRVWAPRPYYGAALIGGVALGTVIAVSAASVVPVAPGPNACWYWSDPTETRGYWDYCTPP